MKIYIFPIWVLIYSISSLINPAYAKCSSANDKLCLMQETQEAASKIEQRSWRDKAYRELAKSYTYEGYEDKAMALIPLVETPDTQAMTIRGIGMAAADSKWNDKKRYDQLFANLAKQAETIEHPPSHAIAYTYIAMAQAFAGDNEGATKTAAGMKNDALRNKAFGETAEIQAERNDFEAAMKSIEGIQSESYRNKALANIARIFSKSGALDHAYACAQEINNTYLKAQILQTIINYDNAEETLPQTKTESR